jgi:hypothetical protein
MLPVSLQRQPRPGTRAELMKKAAKIVTLERKATRITDRLADNDSAKLVSSHGVIHPMA